MPGKALDVKYKQGSQVPGYQKHIVKSSLHEEMESFGARMAANLDWLQANMPPYFFITMKNEIDALTHLVTRLHTIWNQRRVVLCDQASQLIVALPDRPGTLYDTLSSIPGREISYAEIIHSTGPLPGTDLLLEVQRFEFQDKEAIRALGENDNRAPGDISERVKESLDHYYPDFDHTGFPAMLNCLWRNNEAYVRISPPQRIARILWLYQQTRVNDGLYFGVEPVEPALASSENRILFGLSHPPQQGFLTQVLEVFKRLDIGVRRAYSLTIETDDGPYFLGTFYVRAHNGHSLETGSEWYQALKTELYNTQVLSPESLAFSKFVRHRILTGPEASLQEAFISFCHTTLAHSQPDRFDRNEVENAFYMHQEFTSALIHLFEMRFSPDAADRDQKVSLARENLVSMISGYNTGNERLDGIRRTVFETCLLFIMHTLKTNFFVSEKIALGFRLDPAYLTKLGGDFISRLPADPPFRITFFYSRHGVGYHIGFSDIARGGVRTIICRTADELTNNTNTLFREVYVLAHTQHLKNKDIYEGGSKLTIVMDARDLETQSARDRRLHKLQFGIINAFLDLFVTENGKASHPRVVDYYGQEEPIELGPDENMHDDMIERIARQAQKRGYRLGVGIMSSKKAGINHKEYGVTARGVIKSAEIAMKEIGIDIRRDPFSVKVTGGPNGDVAGNSLRLLLERCPEVRIVSIVDGTAGLYDPEGVDPKALAPLLLHSDLDAFPASALHSGGEIVFRQKTRQEGIRTLYLRQEKRESGVRDFWISSDEVQGKFQELTFSVVADLFLPCGGRPETLHEGNVDQFMTREGLPTARVVVEGANSFLSPAAREAIQRKGAVVLRDATANKCGVISSSYEILANLLMTEDEFLEHKEAYIRDVLTILDRRAAEEATLIFKRFRKHEGRKLYTEISANISREINDLYHRLFDSFQKHPEALADPIFQKAFLNHFPAFIRERDTFRQRLDSLPLKIKCAVLASEVASFVIYEDLWDGDLENRARGVLRSALS
ncbi:MAG: NAD-glutamate dehydrogenase domain-containing protein [Desulfobacterales bacterium]